MPFFSEKDTPYLLFATFVNGQLCRFVTKPIDLFCVDSQHKWLNTSANAYLATILRNETYVFFYRLIGGQ